MFMRYPYDFRHEQRGLASGKPLQFYDVVGVKCEVGILCVADDHAGFGHKAE
jgi:hypothetical protein